MAEAPTELGPYTIEREIGRGGMGVVYLGRDTKLDRPVAIKALPEHLAEDPDRLARFEREARTLAQLSHPNVAGIYGVEEQDGARYLVLEFVEGETLAERLDRGALPVDEALELASQIAGGVRAAHEGGVVHRDLKPGNIVVTPQGQAKVLDFGLARADEGASSSGAFSQSPTLTSPAVHSPTVPGVILGTAAYMSPEQARGRGVDKRADIWSFGVVLYEMLVGGSPFAGETVSDSVGAVLHKQIDMDRLPEDAPASIRRVLTRCLQRDRNLRYHDIGDAVLDLEAGEREAAPAPSGTSKGLLAVACAGALVVGAALAWFGLGGGGAPSLAEGYGESAALSIYAPDGHEIYGPIAISPDGRTIAFTADDPFGVGTLYLRDIDGFELREVPRSRDAWSPFFSPDGASVAFHAGGELLRVPVSGGTPRGIADAPSVTGGAWLPSGEIVYSHGVGTGLLRVRDDGTPMEALLPLAEDSPDYAYVWPQWIDGADSMLFTAWVSREGAERGTDGARMLDLATGRQQSFGGGRSREFVPPVRWSNSGHAIFEAFGAGLMVAPFDPGDGELPSFAAATQLLEDLATLGNTTRTVFDLSDNGTLVYVPRPRTDRRLVWVSADGSVEPVLTQAGLSNTRLTGRVALSSDGERALIGGGGDIVEVDLARGLPTPITRQANNSSAFYIGPNEGVGFRSNRAQGWALWRTQRGTSAEPELVVRGTGDIRSADSIPGGGFVYVDDGNLYSVDAEGETRPLHVSESRARSCRASPDGSLVAFTTDDSGSTEVYVLPVDGSSLPTRITTTGGWAPVWAPDGSGVYFRRGRAIMRVSIDGTRPTGDPEQVFAAEFLVGGVSYDISADSTRVLAIQEDAEARQDEIRVITNFFDDIERAAGSER